MKQRLMIALRLSAFFGDSLHVEQLSFYEKEADTRTV